MLIILLICLLVPSLAVGSDLSESVHVYTFDVESGENDLPMSGGITDKRHDVDEEVDYILCTPGALDRYKRCPHVQTRLSNGETLRVAIKRTLDLQREATRALGKIIGRFQNSELTFPEFEQEIEEFRAVDRFASVVEYVAYTDSGSVTVKLYTWFMPNIMIVR